MNVIIKKILVCFVLLQLSAGSVWGFANCGGAPCGAGGDNIQIDVRPAEGPEQEGEPEPAGVVENNETQEQESLGGEGTVENNMCETSPNKWFIERHCK